MRLHELEVAAFGPFTDPVTVDFDELSAAGLFLLSGPTGAGKTSVLDAVCFALYGEVPGDRGGARRLRSDQAAPDAEPRVRLVATLAGRRLELTRSPAWRRPKRRGTGLTDQPASVRVREQVDGAWQTLTTRHDEAGHLVGEALGMSHAQFTQVAMLPQGRFQAFLRADADDRQRLLQQLFGTARFERVETWLRDRRAMLRRRHDATHRVLAQSLSRVGEASGRPLPDWDLDDLAVPTAEGQVTGWTAVLAEAAAAERDHLATATTEAEDLEHGTRLRAEQARTLHARYQRSRSARDALAALHARAADHAEDQAVLDAGRRAAGLGPLVALARAARTAAERADAERVATLAEASVVVDLGQHADAAAWAEVAERERSAAGAARHLLPLARRLASGREEVSAAERRRVVTAERRAAAGRRLAAFPDELATLRAAHEDALRAAGLVENLLSEVHDLDERLAATVEAASHHRALERAGEARRAAQQQTLTLREHLLDVRERRITGMAAELAGALAVGDSCPVCGSAEHPAKAVGRSGSPDRTAEHDAQAALDDASAVETLRAEEERGIEAQLAAALARSGGAEPSTLDAQRADTVARLGAAQTLAVLVPSRAGAVASAERRRDQDRGVVAGLDAELSGLEATLAALRREVVDLEGSLTDVGTDPVALAAAVRRHDQHADLARRAADAVQGALRAGRHVAESTTELSHAAVTAGFDDLDAALAHLLDEPRLTALATRVRDHETRLAATAALVADLDDATDRAELPDLRVVEDAHADALARLVAHRTRLGALELRASRLAVLVEEVRTAADRWRPLHDELALTARLSAFVEGRSSDNRWQIRLSAYVLAFRLGQVVAAANVRLGAMSDQRYSLEHTADRGRDRRGGLGLLVRDDWSGEARNPATLSGGETFVVSLALALGLADVVTAEAGGVELDTLFVDEGFGSLDAETLDDVMSTLDALRDGGRVVGVVSHVAEMRERIPTQLVVTKARRGSTVRVDG